MRKRHLIQQQPLLNEIFKEPHIISYRKGRSLKEILMREEYNKARKPNYVFWSRVGLSAHINTKEINAEFLCCLERTMKCNTS